MSKPGESLDITATPHPWMPQTMYHRVQHCRVMLRVHDFLSEAENSKVAERIRKWRHANRDAAEAVKKGGDDAR